VSSWGNYGGWDAFKNMISGQNWSKWDLDTAQNNPDFGWSIYNYKNDYANATTPEQRNAARSGADEQRGYYGYSGGVDGSKYYSQGPARAGVVSSLSQVESYEPFSYDPYVNSYSDYQKQLLDKAVDRPEFSYAKEDDPVWSSYKKSYLREGERATANALAQASTLTGGRPSSYAVTAASQAGDYYASKLNDVIPQLYQQAYDRYLNDYQMKLSDLNAVNSQQQLEYKKYLDDRGAALDAYNTNYNKILSQLDAFRGVDESNRQWKQQDWENAFNSAGQMGYAADGSPTLQAKTADRDFNIRLLESLGSAATPGIAAGLGLPEGTKTADMALNEWRMAGGGGGGGGSGSRSGGVNDNDNDNDKDNDKKYVKEKQRYSELESLISSGNYTQADINEMLALAPTLGVDVTALKGWIDSVTGGGGGSRYEIPKWDQVGGLNPWDYLPQQPAKKQSGSQSVELPLPSWSYNTEPNSGGLNYWRDFYKYRPF
jgi:hypothetical protein